MQGFIILVSVLAGAYLGIIIYRKVKMPRSGEIQIPAQVDSIFKLRVMLQADTMRNRQAVINPVLPASVYQVVFRDKKTDQMLSFSVKEEIARTLKEKDTGLLTYNGDQLIGFQKG